MTYDNGSEFSYHERVNEELNMKSYFCKPYHVWKKGTVEYINGLVRRFFPKGTDFDNITDKQIQFVEDWINNRPMKTLGFKPPNQKASELNAAIAY
jgi:IS30 family transposase